MSLTLVSDCPDLPPYWDAVPVTWKGWQTGRTTLQLHLPASALACGECGCVDEPKVNMGIRPPAAPTVRVPVVKRTKSGRQYTRATDVESWPVADLAASRCRHCGHDIVTDQRTGQCWDLDDTDYEPKGSVKP